MRRIRDAGGRSVESIWRDAATVGRGTTGATDAPVRRRTSRSVCRGRELQCGSARHLSRSRRNSEYHLSHHPNGSRDTWEKLTTSHGLIGLIEIAFFGVVVEVKLQGYILAVKFIRQGQERCGGSDAFTRCLVQSAPELCTSCRSPIAPSFTMRNPIRTCPFFMIGARAESGITRYL